MRPYVLFGLLFFCASHLSAATNLSDITYKREKNTSVIGLRFSKSVTYHHFALDKPNRLVFDFDKTSLSFSPHQQDLHDKLIKKIRIDEKSTGHLRLVFETTEPVVLEANMRPLLDYFLMTITLKSKARPHSKPANVASVYKPVLKATAASLRDVIVEIDPGHGGKDPGAIGRRGVKEKYIVLAIAKKLKTLIDKTPGMKARLTRKGDYYVGLRKRLLVARDDNADIFISIHADAYKNRRSHGVSVFALSQRGATSEAARWIAEKENYSELGGVDLSGLNDESGLVRSVLIDLSQTATIGASLKLGNEVLQNLDNLTVLHHEGVEQARFVVLKSPDIPSILIETGFISNREEERLLANNWYQEKVARSILKGLKHYFEKFPPRDTYLAHREKHYRVVSGDSLSTIAADFHVSVSDLKKINRLRSSRLVIGQVLMLPKNS